LIRKRCREQLKAALVVGVVSLAASVTSPELAHAQGFFDFLFGGPQQPAPPPPSTNYPPPPPAGVGRVAPAALGQERVTGGGEHLASFARTDRSHRQFCRLCGGHVMTRHPRGGHIDVYAATIPDLAFVPTLHAHYQETVLPMRDGLPKFRDVPAEFGGSGEVMAE